MFVLRGGNDGRSCGTEVVGGSLVMVLRVVVILWGCTVGKYGGVSCFVGEACRARLAVSSPSIDMNVMLKRCQVLPNV